jgi:hypothetical protein
VLEAVAAIQTSITAQKHRLAPTDSATHVIEAIRVSVNDAKARAIQAIEQLTSDEIFAPSLKGVRIIREVTWRLREIGYDGRICDILETQADAIGANYDSAALHDMHQALLSSFDIVVRQLDELTDGPAKSMPTPFAPPPADLT